MPHTTPTESGSTWPKHPLHKSKTNVRWIILAIIFFGLAINYVDRANLSVALPEMEKDLGVGAAAGGAILGAFYWTYSLVQIPLGRIIDKLGSRLMFGLSAVFWSVCTAATATVNGLNSLFGLRLLLGVGEAGAFPSAVKAVSTWFPERERGRATGIYVSGSRAGTIISIPIVVALIAWVGWRGSFIVTGMIGLIWAAIWFWFYRNPRNHWLTSSEEVQYIESGQSQTEIKSLTKIPWFRLAVTRNVLVASAAYFGLTFIEYFFITWFPTYLIDERGFNLLQLGFFGAIPGIAALLGQWLGGFTADYLIQKGISVTVARKSCIAGGCIGSAIIGLAAFVESPALALILLSFSMASATFADASVWCLPADLSPKDIENQTGWEGSIAGVMNGLSNIAGIASPTVIGFLVILTGTFTFGMIVAGVIAIIAVLLFIFGMSKIEALDTQKLFSK